MADEEAVKERCAANTIYEDSGSRSKSDPKARPLERKRVKARSTKGGTRRSDPCEISIVIRESHRAPETWGTKENS